MKAFDRLWPAALLLLCCELRKRFCQRQMQGTDRGRKREKMLNEKIRSLVLSSERVRLHNGDGEGGHNFATKIKPINRHNSDKRRRRRN